MPFDVYEASIPVFARSLSVIPHWLDKAAEAGHDEAAVMAARLAPDMQPFPSQIQIASDTARNSVARLTGLKPPSMPDTESSFEELRDRCRRTVDYLQGVDRAAFEGAEEREVIMKFPGGMTYRWNGRDYLTGFALPNFFFHVSTAYGLLRAAGVPLGKRDFLRHLGPPNAPPG